MSDLPTTTIEFPPTAAADERAVTTELDEALVADDPPDQRLGLPPRRVSRGRR